MKNANVFMTAFLLAQLTTANALSTEILNGGFECADADPWLATSNDDTLDDHAFIIDEGGNPCSFLRVTTSPHNTDPVPVVAIAYQTFTNPDVANCFMTLQFDARCPNADGNPGVSNPDAWVTFAVTGSSTTLEIPQSTGWTTYWVSLPNGTSGPNCLVRFGVSNGLNTGAFGCEADETPITLDVDNVCVTVTRCDESTAGLVESFDHCNILLLPIPVVPPGSGADCETPACPADECGCPDIDRNGTVDDADLFAIIGAYGACGDPCGPCVADVNCDDTVNITDLLAVIAAYGTNPCPPVPACP
jgi:hypothetical protein